MRADFVSLWFVFSGDCVLRCYDEKRGLVGRITVDTPLARELYKEYLVSRFFARGPDHRNPFGERFDGLLIFFLTLAERASEKARRWLAGEVMGCRKCWTTRHLCLKHRHATVVLALLPWAEEKSRKEGATYYEVTSLEVDGLRVVMKPPFKMEVVDAGNRWRIRAEWSATGFRVEIPKGLLELGRRFGDGAERRN